MKQELYSVTKGATKCQLCSVKCSQVYDGFYFITHINNLESILENGIKCKNSLDESQKTYRSIAINDIQQRRHDVMITEHNNLHDFVPLYITLITPMLYEVIKRPIKDFENEDIVVLNIKCRVITKLKDVFYSDGNLGDQDSQFYPISSWDEFIDRQVLFKPSDWGDDEIRRRVSSEILVYNNIPPEYIKQIYVNNENTKKQIESKYSKYNKKVNIHQYFNKIYNSVVR